MPGRLRATLAEGVKTESGLLNPSLEVDLTVQTHHPRLCGSERTCSRWVVCEAGTDMNP
jgi:hypothetical protein